MMRLADGVYRSHADGVPEFIEVAAPTEEGLHELLQTVIARLMTLLTRRGVLVEDDGQSYLAESDTDAEEARTLDGTTHLLLSPLEFMQRLAALVPRPRLHLIRYHGVLAPNARLRPLVVPREPEVQERAAEVAVAGECVVQTVQSRPHRI